MILIRSCQVAVPATKILGANCHILHLLEKEFENFKFCIFKKDPKILIMTILTKNIEFEKGIAKDFCNFFCTVTKK